MADVKSDIEIWAAVSATGAVDGGLVAELVARAQAGGVKLTGPCRPGSTLHDPLNDHFNLAAKVIFDPWLIVYMDGKTSAGDSGSNDNSTTSTSDSRLNSGSGTSGGPAGVVTIGHTEMAHLRCRVPAPRPDLLKRRLVN